MEMKITAEQIFREPEDASGFDIRITLTETGTTTPPDEIIIEMPEGEVISFDRCGSVVGSCDRFLYWSYWNCDLDAVGKPSAAINLQVFNR